jgi:hypothetical protein
MKLKLILLLAALVAAACGSPRGLKAQAASDMKCDEDRIKTSKTRSGYSGDDFGARYEVEGCGEKVIYEKKNADTWAAVTEAESLE